MLLFPLYFFYDTTDAISPDQLLKDLHGLSPQSSGEWIFHQVLFELHLFFEQTWLGLGKLLFLGMATLVGGIVFLKLGGFHGCCSDLD